MIREIAFMNFFGQSVVFWLGLITLIFLILTFLSGFLNKRGINLIPMKYHFVLAPMTLVFALIHAGLVIGSKLGF